MIKLTASKVFTFDSAHKLEGYEGKCARLHGHTYKLIVTVERIRLKRNDYVGKDGMVIDFSALKAIVNGVIIDKVDHYPLHEIFTFRTTAENLILWIKNELREAFDPYDFRLTKLRLYETPDSYVEVTDD